MGVRPLVVVVSGSAVNEPAMASSLKRACIDGNTFGKTVGDPKPPASRSAYMSESDRTFTRQRRCGVTNTHCPDIGVIIAFYIRGEKHAVGAADPVFVACRARGVGIIRRQPLHLLGTDFQNPQVHMLDFRHQVGLYQKPVASILSELLVLEIVLCRGGPGLCSTALNIQQ